MEKGYLVAEISYALEEVQRKYLAPQPSTKIVQEALPELIKLFENYLEVEKLEAENNNLARYNEELKQHVKTQDQKIHIHKLDKDTLATLLAVGSLNGRGKSTVAIDLLRDNLVAKLSKEFSNDL